ncbi:MAG: hypothetical protein J07HX64_02574 [halophilic archaeon J07HX64]|jgi:hypothetical protein|nr:MAG: hypothetical protein J07HX64_02574 [halophilic archaeon J07HX64]
MTPTEPLHAGDDTVPRVRSVHRRRHETGETVGGSARNNRPEVEPITDPDERDIGRVLDPVEGCGVVDRWGECVRDLTQNIREPVDETLEPSQSRVMSCASSRFVDVRDYRPGSRKKSVTV